MEPYPAFSGSVRLFENRKLSVREDVLESQDIKSVSRQGHGAPERHALAVSSLFPDGGNLLHEISIICCAIYRGMFVTTTCDLSNKIPARPRRLSPWRAFAASFPENLNSMFRIHSGTARRCFDRTCAGPSVLNLLNNAIPNTRPSPVNTQIPIFQEQLMPDGTVRKLKVGMFVESKISDLRITARGLVKFSQVPDGT